MKRLFKTLVLMAAILAILLIAGIIVLYLSLGRIVKTGVETLGPKFTGAPVKVASVSFSAFSGKVQIKGVEVGNPEGFKTPSAFKLSEIRVQVVPSSMFTDTIVVREIFIDAPEITYELSLKGSNIGKIQENVEAATGGAAATTPKPAEPTAPPTGGGKKVIIEDLQVVNGKIRLAETAIGTGLTVPLPAVHMKDIGKAKDGASVGEAAQEVFKSVTSAVSGAVSGAADVLKKQASEVGTAVKESGKALGAKASDVGKSIGNLFKKE